MTEQDPFAGVEFAARWRRRGRTRRPLESGARSGELVRVRRGAYTDAEQWRSLDAVARHLEQMLVMREQLPTSRLVFSHASAAAVLGLPIIDAWPARPHLTTPARSGRRTNRSTCWHVTDLEPGDITETGGIQHTSEVRTALDLAATCSPDQGVVAVDWLLGRSPDPESLRASLREIVDRRRPFPGVRRVDAAIRIGTGLSESPLESISLARFAEWGLPVPEQQVVFRLPEGIFRVDFFWRELGLIGEADGRLKYREAADLWQEKRREDALRRAASGLVRWDWSDARSERLRSLLRTAGLVSQPRLAHR